MPASATPPFTIRQILNMAWGLTSKYSHDEKQNIMGDFFMKEIKSILDSYRAADEESKEQPKHIEHYTSEAKLALEEAEEEKKQAAQKEKERRFVESTIVALSKAARNLGLARDSHVTYLQDNAQQYNDRKEYLDEISSFSSFSPEGLLPKIITFVGGGSVITVLKEFKDLFNFSDITLMPGDVLIFVGAGVAVMAATTVGVKVWKNYSLTKWRNELCNEGKKYWEGHMRVTMVSCLFDLYRDMRVIMKEFDDRYTETDFISSHQPQSESADDNTAKSVIEREIIHPIEVQYPGLIISATQPKPAKKEDSGGKKASGKEEGDEKED